MKKNIVSVCLATVLCLSPVCAEGQGNPSLADSPTACAEAGEWARLKVYEAPFGGGHSARTHPGGFLEYHISMGSGMHHVWQFLLSRDPGGHHYRWLFSASNINGQGDSFMVKGSTVEYHFNENLGRRCKGGVVSYPLSEEGAKAWKADKPRYDAADGKVEVRDVSGGWMRSDVESADGSLLLLSDFRRRHTLFVRCEDGESYFPVAKVVTGKNVRSIEREGDMLVLQAEDGSECRVPLACGRYYVPLDSAPEKGWSPLFHESVGIEARDDDEEEGSHVYFIVGGGAVFAFAELGKLPEAPVIAGAAPWCVLLTGAAKDGGFSLVRKMKDEPLQVTDLTPLCLKALGKKGRTAGTLAPLWAEMPGQPQHWQGPREEGRVYFAMRSASGAEYVFSVSRALDVRVEQGEGF